MTANTMLGIVIKNNSKENILEQIKKYIDVPGDFFHVVSLNPEIMVISESDPEFKKTLSEGDIKLIDGVGILLGCAILGIPVGERTPGVDMMDEVLQSLDKRGLRVLFMGGQADLAEKLALCYQKKYPHYKFKGMIGFKDILAPGRAEHDEVWKEIRAFSPQIIFSAYGSPAQELFFYRHRALLPKVIGMGVGGGFDFAYQNVPRAPLWFRAVGLEWLFRLAIQPWRVKRQLRLLRFLYLVLRQKLSPSQRESS